MQGTLIAQFATNVQPSTLYQEISVALKNKYIIVDLIKHNQKVFFVRSLDIHCRITVLQGIDRAEETSSGPLLFRDKWCILV